ncbi:hypothetical protein EDD15DRAFT_2366283 [Pisolithus albus]|nr:hypothetical protein EDD15DRAFT_2366283 [Pisolithus albus]
MEYWQRLGKLEASSQRLHEILDTWNVFEATSTTYGGDTKENYDKDLLVVQELEHKLNVSWRWVPEDKEWQQAGRLVANREYRHALDILENLVVARLFELTKMNRAGTGYKLWKHIAKALQTRSAAIKVALEHYNKLHSQFNASHLKRLHDIASLPGFSGTIFLGESALKGPGESNSKPAIIIPACLLAPIQPPLSQIVHPNTLDSIQDLEEEEEAECEAEEASHALQDVLEVSFDPE